MLTHSGSAYHHRSTPYRLLERHCFFLNLNIFENFFQTESQPQASVSSSEFDPGSQQFGSQQSRSQGLFDDREVRQLLQMKHFSTFEFSERAMFCAAGSFSFIQEKPAGTEIHFQIILVLIQEWLREN